ncbi:hypothetical protein NDU88_007981 [Pleurodeles waltl]|uniref:Uncharacterized protein n=1 Tax=Pleurodeles waltl TaxID=8319 RepID=A0AAV7RUC8_PLEWA|nr:hypothetical protein NDU88_007981 [Pleurodeles waltl]
MTPGGVRRRRAAEDHKQEVPFQPMKRTETGAEVSRVAAQLRKLKQMLDMLWKPDLKTGGCCQSKRQSPPQLRRVVADTLTFYKKEEEGGPAAALGLLQ